MVGKGETLFLHKWEGCTEKLNLLKAPTLSVGAYTAFKPNSTIRIFDEIFHLLIKTHYNIKTLT